MNKNLKIFYAGVLLVSPFLVQIVSATENSLPLEESSKNVVTDKDDDPIFKPKKGLDWSVRPQLLTGAMYFKHFTLDKISLSNKPVPFLGIGLNTTLDNWFLNGYVLDSAKTNDHVFEKGTTLTEANYNFYRRDYSVSFGREVTDWLTDSKNWGISLFLGYRQGKTFIESASVNFYPTALPDTVTLVKGQYTIKGPMIGAGLRILPFKNSNTQIGLTVGYGPLNGEYQTTTNTVMGPGGAKQYSETISNKVNGLVTALSWTGELTPALSYSLLLDYYSYSMPLVSTSVNRPQTSETFNVKEAVSSLKLFLNYRF